VWSLPARKISTHRSLVPQFEISAYGTIFPAHFESHSVIRGSGVKLPYCPFHLGYMALASS
jgi:hypothetical protein